MSGGEALKTERESPAETKKVKCMHACMHASLRPLLLWLPFFSFFVATSNPLVEVGYKEERKEVDAQLVIL